MTAEQLRLAVLIDALDASIARGVDDADAGRVRSSSEVFNNLALKLEAILREGRCASPSAITAKPLPD
jgi:hypothetical protein